MSSTKDRFAKLVDDGADTERLLRDLEGLVAKAKELRIEYQPVLQRHQQAMQTAGDALAESMVLAQVVGDAGPREALLAKVGQVSRRVRYRDLTHGLADALKEPAHTTLVSPRGVLRLRCQSRNPCLK